MCWKKKTALLNKTNGRSSRNILEALQKVIYKSPCKRIKMRMSKRMKQRVTQHLKLERQQQYLEKVLIRVQLISIITVLIKIIWIIISSTLSNWNVKRINTMHLLVSSRYNWKLITKKIIYKKFIKWNIFL